MQVKLITYNIWHGQHLDGVIEFLKSEQVDIICLQELATTGRGLKADATINLFNEVKKAIGGYGEYRRMFWGENEGGRWDMGVGIYAKQPILETTEFAYEAGTDLTVNNPDVFSVIPRVLLGVKIQKMPVWVFTTHMTITPEASVTDRQLISAQELKRFLQNYHEYILCGDMNTPYGNETYKILSEGLTDVSEPTKPTLHPTIHRVGFKKLHVDYVFIKGERIKHVYTQIPVIDASDHLPIVVELEI